MTLPVQQRSLRSHKAALISGSVLGNGVPRRQASLAASTTAMAAAPPDAKNVFGEADVTELCASLRDKIRAVRDGNMDGPEALLVGQAIALNLIYTELTRRAALNMGEYIQAAERHMKLALKAQAQCRATIETLAAIKNHQWSTPVRRTLLVSSR